MNLKVMMGKRQLKKIKQTGRKHKLQKKMPMSTN
jgi:hypothetical protein